MRKIFLHSWKHQLVTLHSQLPIMFFGRASCTLKINGKGLSAFIDAGSGDILVGMVFFYMFNF